jgi:hypothetical protein
MVEMAQVESEMVETSVNISPSLKSTITAPSGSKVWHFLLRCVISFLEALGRSSEEYYVQLPYAVAVSSLRDRTPF